MDVGLAYYLFDQSSPVECFCVRLITNFIENPKQVTSLLKKPVLSDIKKRTNMEKIAPSYLSDMFLPSLNNCITRSQLRWIYHFVERRSYLGSKT